MPLDTDKFNLRNQRITLTMFIFTMAFLRSISYIYWWKLSVLTNLLWKAKCTLRKFTLSSSLVSYKWITFVIETDSPMDTKLERHTATVLRHTSTLMALKYAKGIWFVVNSCVWKWLSSGWTAEKSTPEQTKRLKKIQIKWPFELAIFLFRLKIANLHNPLKVSTQKAWYSWWHWLTLNHSCLACAFWRRLVCIGEFNFGINQIDCLFDLANK